MKFYSLLIVISLVFATGCDKEDAVPQKTTEEVVKEQITEDLSGIDDLSEFLVAFENLEIEPGDIENGITIFAPSNNGTQPSGGRSGRTAEDITQLTPELLEGHIVKGLIEAAGLNDGDTLITLNGKFLKVSVNGGEIRVNGVLISGKDLANSEKYVVHKVEEILTHAVATDEPVTLEVTVWNGAKWTTENPKGEIEAGVMVSLYNSREDYALGNPLYTQETDAEGKAAFQDIDGGKAYYVVAKKGDLSNIFYQSVQTESNVYTGRFPDGIFQTQDEVNAHAVQSDGMPGNFRWNDVNGDGKIDNGDRVPVPHKEIIPAESITQVEVIIGYGNNEMMTIRNGEDALQTLANCYDALNDFHKTLVMTDGMLSDDADCGSILNWCAVDDFSFIASNTTFTKLWNDAYNNVGQLNLLLRDVPAHTFTEKNTVLAEAKGLRAYIYLQLLPYFGDIPTPDGIMLEGDVVRTSMQDVFALIQNDLESAASVLPIGQLDNPSMLSSDAVKVLLARAALLNNDYAAVVAYTDELLQSNRYQLMGSSTEAFNSVNNAEIIWDFSFDMSAEFSAYFYDRPFCPAARLPEVYLMNAEAQFEMNSLEAGRTSLNVIRERMGLLPSAAVTKVELTEELRTAWKTEMSREGSRFANVVRWGIAPEVLGPKGYEPNRHSLLPVPQTFLDQHPNLLQNPGY